MIKVFFFGDSICFGQGISLHKGWVPRISMELEKVGKNYSEEILVVNSAVNGRTTRQALLDMPYEVQSHSPDFLLIQFGMNDCNYWATDLGNPRVSKRSFKANLCEIIERGISSGAKRIFLNTNHPTCRDDVLFTHAEITYQQSNADYNVLIREVAGNYCDNVLLFDMERKFQELSSCKEALAKFVLSDKLHLSEMGHEIYYSTIAPKIVESVVAQIEKKHE